MKTILQRLHLLLLLLPFTAVSQWTQLGEKQASLHANSTYTDWFGSAVSLSADGTVMAVGATNNQAQTNQMDIQTYVQVFRLESNSWVQIGGTIYGAKNLTTYNSSSQAGYSVSLSADGNILAVGEPFWYKANGDEFIFGGRVRLFENTNDEWVQIGEDIFEPNNGRFGFEVSLSSDGGIVAVYSQDVGDYDFKGLVKVFQNVSGSWVQMGNTLSGTAPYDYLGKSLHLSSDGTLLAVGVPGEWSNESRTVKLYEYGSNQWNVAATITEAGTESFGKILSMSADGTRLAIGAPFSDEYSGSVKIYEKVEGVWTESYSIIGGEWEFFGSKVELSADGNVLIAYSNSMDVFSLKVFQKIGEEWVVVGNDFPSIDYDVAFSVSADGSIFTMGNPFLDNGYGEVVTYKNCSIAGDVIDVPQATSPQGYAVGATLANLAVAGNEGATFVWYADANKAQKIEGVTQLTNGTTYFVAQMLVGCESEAIAITVDSSLGKTEFDLSDFRYYPNPVKDILYFSAESNVVQSVQVYDVTGKLVVNEILNSYKQEVDLALLSPAIYLVKAQTYKGVQVFKVFKK